MGGLCGRWATTISTRTGKAVRAERSPSGTALAEDREAALHPERHPGLVVQAAYFAHGKLFVHGGILPNIVDLARREQGARGAEEIASYVNEVFRRVLVERERITARDLPHEIFRIGTSHTSQRRLPGEIGYEPAGIFTPDLREVDHYRYHDTLLPQVIGHTASKNGEIRYSPGSWLQRDYIAIDVGRQHGTGNGGLLLTDFGWVAVTPGGPARLVEMGPLFVRLAHEAAAGETRPEESRRGTLQPDAHGLFASASPRGDRSGRSTEPSSWLCPRSRLSRWSGSLAQSGSPDGALSSPTWTRGTQSFPELMLGGQISMF